MGPRTLSATCLVLGAIDLIALNLAIGPRVLTETPLIAVLDDATARQASEARLPPPTPRALLSEGALASAAPRDDAPRAPRPAVAAIAARADDARAPAVPTQRATVAATLAAAVEEPPPTQIVVHYATDRATITPQTQARLNQIAVQLAAHPDWSIQVAGHADLRGSDDHNDLLSARRVRRVREYLATLGIAPERVVGRAFGKHQPIVAANDADACMRNRRVEITFTRSQP